MKRDISIPISVAVVIAAFLIIYFAEPAEVIDSESPFRWQLLLWPTWLASLRLVALWFQTLYHVVYDNTNQQKMIWILGHLFFGPFSSLYYYFYCSDSNKKPNKPEQATPRNSSD